MCAIFGLGFMRGHKVERSDMVRDIIRRMFVENQARGRHAAGLAFVNSATFHVVKKNVDGQRLIELPEYREAEHKYMTFSTATPGQGGIIAKQPPISFVGHCRWKTKGTELDNVNNHPIVRKDVVGVHNGMISNDDRIFDIYSKTFPRNGRVDSEIIFALIEHFSKNLTRPIHESIGKTAETLRGGMACAFVHRLQPYAVWLFRRGNPCDVLIFRDVGMIAWSSCKHYIMNSVRKYENDLGKAEVVELDQNAGMGIDLHRNLVHRFTLNDYHHNTNAMSAI
jgi:glucosamine 6-phosphate synthetase-like amidotransferase/phosphosugar isomerase protein